MEDMHVLWLDQGRLAEAEALGTEVVVLRNEVLGEGHPDSIKSVSFLAGTCPNMGQYSEAGKGFDTCNRAEFGELWIETSNHRGRIGRLANVYVCTSALRRRRSCKLRRSRFVRKA